MNMADKVVTLIPLSELWDNSSLLPAVRLRYLDAADLKNLLRDSSFAFVIADVGIKLRWIDAPDRFQFWKNEVRPHLYTEDRPYLEDYPNDYFYVASEWLIEPGKKAILLEKYH